MGVIHSHLSAALPKQGGEMAVGNSPPLNRVIPTIYTEQDISKHFDILSNDQDIFVYFNVQRYSEGKDDAV